MHGDSSELYRRAWRQAWRRAPADAGDLGRASVRVLPRLGLVAAAASSLLALGGCKQVAAPPPPPPPEVTVDLPRIQDVTVYFEYTANLAAVETAEVRARVAGFLERIAFDDSSDVTQGQLLFVIEQQPYTVAVDQARADLARAKAESQLAQARIERTRRAFERKAVSEIEMIEARAGAEQAAAEVAAAKAALARAELDLAYTEVHSPIAGRIGRHLVDAGNLVGAGDNTLLATVVRMDPIHAYFDVSESVALQYLARGDGSSPGPDAPKAFLSLSGESGWPHEGRIDYVDNAVDPDTGTLRTRAVFANPDGRLYPGLFARVRVPFETRKNALLVDENAIATDLNGKYLLLVGKDDIVERSIVELGGRYDAGVEIVKGLTAGQRYVVSGLQRARPGMPVKPLTRAQTAAAEKAAGADGNAASKSAATGAAD